MDELAEQLEIRNEIMRWDQWCPDALENDEEPEGIDTPKINEQ